MKYVLKVYVAGETFRSRRTRDDLHQLFHSQFQGEYSLEVIDVLKHPDVAVRDKVIATPTLIKELPEPIQRVTGNLSKDSIMQGLQLHSAQ